MSSILSRGAIDRGHYGLNPNDTFRTFQLLGYNPSVSSVTFDDVWPTGGTRTWPVAEGVVTIASDSVADTLLGAGARSVLLVGVDAGFKEIFEVVSLAGTTPVFSTKLFYRLSLMDVSLSGTFGDSNTNSNAGKITATIDGDIQQTIEEAADGISPSRQTLLAATIPVDYTGYIDELIVNVASKRDLSLNVFIRNAEVLTGGNFHPKIQLLKVFVPDGVISFIFPTPITLPPKHDIWITCKTIGGGGDAELNVDLLARMIKNRVAL